MAPKFLLSSATVTSVSFQEVEAIFTDGSSPPRGEWGSRSYNEKVPKGFEAPMGLLKPPQPGHPPGWWTQSFKVGAGSPEMVWWNLRASSTAPSAGRGRGGDAGKQLKAINNLTSN